MEIIRELFGSSGILIPLSAGALFILLLLGLEYKDKKLSDILGSLVTGDTKLLGSTPKGSFSKVSGTGFEIFAWMTICIGFTMFWIMVNIEGLFKTSVIYFCMILYTVTVFSTEIANKSVPWSFFGFGNKEEIPRNLAFGGLVFLMYMAVKQIFPPLKIGFGIPIPRVLLFGVLTVWIEEVAFGSYATATLGEDGGLIAVLLTIPVVFGIFHFATYGASIILVASAVLFRALASTFQCISRSILPGLVPHLMINIIAIVSGLEIYAVIISALLVVLLPAWMLRH